MKIDHEFSPKEGWNSNQNFNFKGQNLFFVLIWLRETYRLTKIIFMFDLLKEELVYSTNKTHMLSFHKNKEMNKQKP